jgi:hypothetical protein
MMSDTELNDVDLTGIGEHRPDNRRGYLVFASLPDAVQRAEDGRAYADLEARSWRASVTRTRPATATERALLAYVLERQIPNNLETVVQWLSNGVRNRSWPTLGINQEGELR